MSTRERPILFSDAMVRAILDGRKTQTRRMVKPQPSWISEAWHWVCKKLDAGYCHTRAEALMRLMLPHCPYGQPGHRLWVREAHALMLHADGERVHYRADGDNPVDWRGNPLRWTPSIHMPRWASRILLEITGVRVERLQQITKKDALAEGVTQRGAHYSMDWSGVGKPTGIRNVDGTRALATEAYLGNDNAIGAFATYWENLSGPNSWNANPWVWVVEFKRVKS